MVVANVHLVLKSESYAHFLEGAAKRPLTDLVAKEDLLVAALAEVQQDPDFRARLKEAIARTDKNDSRAKIQEALRLVEGCEDISASEMTALVILLRKFKDSTEPLDEVLDSLAEVADIVRWARLNPKRLKELREAMGPDHETPARTISQIAETLRTFSSITSEETLQILQSIRGCEAGVRRYLAHNMPLIRALVQTEYKESDLVAIKYRQQQLEVFRTLLADADYFESMKEAWSKRRPEDVWQHVFETNPWIFGYGLHYIFLTSLDGRKLEQVTAGFQLDQCGKRTDALMKTRGKLSSMCFCEIKTHETKLLGGKEPYRPGCWSVSEELAGSIAQIQKTVARFLMREKRRVEIKDSEGNPSGEEIWFHAPRSFVVIGCLSEFMVPAGVNEDKFSSFELFRDGIRYPEIITFDELYERATHIVRFGEWDTTRAEPVTSTATTTTRP